MHRHLNPSARAGAPLALALAAALALTGTATAHAATTNPGQGSLELKNAALSKRAATEGMVLLENKDSALPIAKSGNVAVFGVGAYKTVKGGTGSGSVNARYVTSVRDGLENAGYNVTTSDEYWNAMLAAVAANTGAPGGFGDTTPVIAYDKAEAPLTASSVQPKAATDVALYVLPRNSGEGKDRSSGQGDYELTDIERGNIEMLGKSYKKVVVLLNVGGIVDTAWYDAINASEKDPSGGTAVDSLVVMSQGGQETGDAVVELLNGTVTPSGKLTDTWASKYSYYPASATIAGNDGDSATEKYDEGVYVGYRYFDSFYKSIDPANTAGVVDYPFGYGLSYTDFQIDTQSVTADIHSVTVKARVTNVGATYSGKEVVEVYASAPQTGVDKPYQELRGYAKTDVLAPGAAQTVTITFDTASLASYDVTKAANVLDAGDYVIRVGSSSRNTHVAAKLNIASTTIVEQLANELDGADPATDRTSDPTNFYTYPTEAAELAAAPRVAISTAGFVAPNHASANEQDVAASASGPTAPYYAIDGDKISSTTAYLPSGQTAWENTGAPYQPKAGETVKSVTTNPAATLYDVYRGTTTMEQLVAGLSVEQLANVVEGATVKGSTLTATGAAGYTTAKYEAKGIPGMTLADGPAGVRITQKPTTTPVATYQFATAFPIGTLLAQTWDRELVQEVGAAIGEEMLEYGATLWLAPGMNIHRDPLNGRNFEYYSEDPLVTGLTAASETKGVQSNPGVGVTIKHYAMNNQETSRNSFNAVVSERAAREIYLRGFEIAVKSAQPMAVMNSYNKINGSYTAASHDVNMDLLRGEWGFKGLVMTDWGGVGQSGVVPTLYGGNDLIMPGNNPAQVINATLLVQPSIDSNGTPVYIKSITPTRTSYTLQTGGLTLSATGDQSISTTVSSSTDLSQTSQSTVATTDAINNQTVVPVPAYGTVDAAYQAATELLSALSAAQQAAITISDVVRQTPGDASTPVVSYKVTIKGSYPAASTRTLRLGDLQRAARNVLTVVMHSAPFAELAGIQGVSGVTALPYTATFSGLRDFVTSSSDKVVVRQTGHGPSLSLATTTSAPASGWFKGAVQVKTTTDDGAQAYVDNGSGELRAYAGPVTISGDGTHTVRAFSVDADGQYSKIVTLTVKIDGTAPTVKASAPQGRLTLKASDAGSGVASVQYSTDSGRSWKAYQKVVTFSKATTVTYRSTDKAGNVSATGKITVVAAKITVAKKAKVSGKAKVGKKLKVTKGTYEPSGTKVSYQWLRGSKAIKGATKASYKVKAKDKGKKLSVKVTVKKAGYKNLTVTTAKTAKVKKR